jgi:hypothetical protein
MTESGVSVFVAAILAGIVVGIGVSYWCVPRGSRCFFGQEW